jgi:predicted MPP superfamily phosphohydrolase
MLYRFVLFIGSVQTILFLAHWFLYKTLVRFIVHSNPTILLSLKVILGLLSVSLVSVSFLAFRYSNIWVRCLYTAAASWLGILYFLFLVACLSWLTYGCTKLFHFSLNQRLLAEILFGVAILASLYGVINSGLIRVTRINLELPHLPSQWRGKTAVWVSDTHLGQVRNYNFAKHIATMVQNLHPDIFFIGGDLYDGVAGDLDKMIEPFSQISAPQGAYFITGNHEEFSDNTRYLQAIRHAGIRILKNEMINLDGLQIIGVDYRDSRSEQGFRMILQQLGIDRNKPSILLKHAPLNLQVAKEEGISLQLSGHTHRGQLFLFRWITSRVYRGYDYGLNRFGNLLVYTSSGTGTWGPPMRVDTHPEIVVITFQ